MQKSIVIPIILMIMMAFPAFGTPQGTSTDFNTIPIKSHPTLITNQETMQETMQEYMPELASTGNVTSENTTPKSE